MQLKEIIQIIKDKREELGLTIEEVSRQTKINSMVLSNIEQGELKKISTVYLKGFLKIYIQFLGLEREMFSALDEALKKENPAVSVKKIVEPSKKERAPAAPKMPPITKIMAAFFQAYGKTIIIVLAVLCAAFLFAKGCSFAAKKFQSRKKASAAVRVPFPVKSERPVSSRSGSSSAGTVAEVKIESKQQKKQAELHLVIRAKKDCFVRLRKDGMIVFDGVIPRGTIESWVAQKEIEASINDSTAVEIEVNGENVSLGTRKRSIKSLKVTPGSIRIQ